MKNTIGIFYNDFDWACNFFDKIVGLYPQTGFAKIIKNKHQMEISFNDGSKIIFIDTNHFGKLCRFTRVLIHSDVDEEFIKRIIYPTVANKYGNIMILNEENDISFL